MPSVIFSLPVLERYELVRKRTKQNFHVVEDFQIEIDPFKMTETNQTESCLHLHDIAPHYQELSRISQVIVICFRLICQ